MVGVGEPVARDRRTRRLRTHRPQVRRPDQPAAAQLGGTVRRAVGSGQFGGPGPGGAAAGQRRRADVEDEDPGGDPAAPGVAQQGAVADPQRQRLREREPGGVGAQRAHPHGHGGRADVQRHLARQVVGRVAAEPDVDEVGEQPRVGGQQGGAAAYLVRLHAAQVDGDAGGASMASHRTPSDCSPRTVTAPRPARSAAGHRCDRARGQRAGDDRAGAADGEGPVHPQPDRRGEIRRRKRGDEPIERGAQLLEARPGRAADRDRLDRSQRVGRSRPARSAARAPGRRGRRG